MFIIIHIVFLHEKGSDNPNGLSGDTDIVFFHPYFIYKDLTGVTYYIFILILITFFNPHLLGDPENFILANPLITPEHIAPE